MRYQIFVSKPRSTPEIKRIYHSQVRTSNCIIHEIEESEHFYHVGIREAQELYNSGLILVVTYDGHKPDVSSPDCIVISNMMDEITGLTFDDKYKVARILNSFIVLWIMKRDYSKFMQS